ncbi:MAG TPA: FtsX-like permease family protein [Thermoleophilia bacterium]|nr:FtsX-like permease family protein [Thermoleophilia bacterium]
MGVLSRKLRRDLWERKGQLGAVIITIFLGVVLFGASYDAFLDLQASYQSLYDTLRFADFTIETQNPEQLARSGGELDGVAASTIRPVAEIPLRVAGEHKLLGRLVGLPAGEQPAVNQVMVLEGRYLNAEAPADVLLEQHMADHFGLSPGDRLEVLAGDGWRQLTVAGVVASPEYLWPARDRQEILTSADDFGVAFASEEVLSGLPSSAVTRQALFFYDPEADRGALDAALSGLAREQEAGAAFSRAEQASNAALQEDVQGFSELSFMFPLLFLGAAGMATYVLLTRLVYSQRSIIGLLRASGFSRRRVFRHYLVYGLVVGLLGSIPGIAVGILAGRLIAGFYTDAISVPVTVIDFHPLTLILGPVFGLLAGTLSALAPAFRATRMAPGAAMRGTGASRGGPSLLERLLPPLGRLPAWAKLVLRGIGRNKRRSLSTMLGVILALVLILVSWGMLDTTQLLLDRQFQQIEQQDAQLYFAPTVEKAPGSAQAGLLLEQIRAVQGIERVEGVLETPVVLETAGQRYATTLKAFGRETQMHDFLLSSGEQAQLPEQGVYVGVALRDQLGFAAGDRVTVRLPEAGLSLEEVIAGFVEEPLGTLVYANLGYLADRAGTSSQALANSAAVRYAEGAIRSDMRSRLTALPSVAAFVDSRALVETIKSFMGLFYAFVGVMLAFGGVMAFALIFNTMSANISERATEIATLKAAGVGRRTITGLITAENILLTLLAIVPGLALGYLAAWYFMGSYSSDLFRFDLHVRPLTFVFSAAGILLVALLSQWPILRVVQRLDVAKVVRERAV